jgi:hypothetical protein
MVGRCTPGPFTSQFDHYHYRLLFQHSDCKKEQLEVAWEDWLRIGEYANGEAQRKNVVIHFRGWRNDVDTYKTLRKEIDLGFNGTSAQKSLFKAKWEEQAQKEEKENQKGREEVWTNWEDVQTLIDDYGIWYEDFEVIRDPALALFLEGIGSADRIGAADRQLGKRLYRRTRRGDKAKTVRVSQERNKS